MTARLGHSDYDLNVVRCTSSTCVEPDTDGDGCTDAREVQLASGSELSGGRREPKNPNDYFNPTGDGQNRVDDILAVVDAYFDDDDDTSPGMPPYEPGYSPATDRDNDRRRRTRGTRTRRTGCSVCRTSCTA